MPSPQAPAAQPSKPKTEFIRSPAPIAETRLEGGLKAEPPAAVPTVSKESSSPKVVEEVPQHPPPKLRPGAIIPAEKSAKSEPFAGPSRTEKVKAQVPSVSKPVAGIEKQKVKPVPGPSVRPASGKLTAADSSKPIESPTIPGPPKFESAPSRIGRIKDEYGPSLGESPPGLLQAPDAFKPPRLPPKPPGVPAAGEIGTKVSFEKTAPPASPPTQSKSIGGFAKVQKGMARLRETISAGYLSKHGVFSWARKALDNLNGRTKARVFGAIAIIVLLLGVLWFVAIDLMLIAQERYYSEPCPAVEPPAGIVPQERTPEKSSGPPVASVPPSPSATATELATGKSTGTPAPGLAASTPSPHLKGLLTIDSVPEGVAFEVIDGDFNQRTGTTHATLELPTGYTRIIFKWKTFEHRENVWVEGGKTVATTWDAPVEDVKVEPRSSPFIPPAAATTATPMTAEQAPAQSASPAEAVATPAQPSATLSGRGDRTWQAWIGDFVRQFVMANQSQDIEADLACYALSVDYFGDRNTNQAFIRTDVEKYNVRWPIRHDSIEGDIHLQEKAMDRDYTANFKLNFYAESQERHIWTKGQFQIDLEISVLDGALKIVGIKEKMLHQQKGVPAGPPKQSSAPARYPVGIPVAGKRGFAKSPYAPAKNDLDLRPYKKGSQVKCPYTGRIFIVP